MPTSKSEDEALVKKSTPHEKIKLAVDKDALKKFRLVVVAYSSVQREHFATKSAYEAEVEVEERAIEVSEEIRKLEIPVRTLPGDQYFYTNLLVDKPDLVVNLVDTLKGRDQLQPSVPAALELANIPYTGAGMEGLIIGNNRNLTKRLLMAYDIPTPPFQFIRRAGTSIDEDLGLPLIVKLNEGGGSVGIDNHAVKESFRAAMLRVNKMITTYHYPVIVEKFIGGPEITVVVLMTEPNGTFLWPKKFSEKSPTASISLPVLNPMRMKGHINIFPLRTIYATKLQKWRLGLLGDSSTMTTPSLISGLMKKLQLLILRTVIRIRHLDRILVFP